MFLRKTQRKKDGKTHEYWSVVESKRVAGGGVVQRHVLYLGEINSSQAAAWRKAIEVLDDHTGRPRTMALFPEDRCTGLTAGAQVRPAECFSHRPRRQAHRGRDARDKEQHMTLMTGSKAPKRMGRRTALGAGILSLYLRTRPVVPGSVS